MASASYPLASKPKANYPELVKQRARVTHEKIMGIDDEEQAVNVIYEALKTTALESWKNGLSAGSRKTEAKPALTSAHR